MIVQDVHFHGLKAPLRLTGAAHLLPLLARVAAGWPHTAAAADPTHAPFFSITARPDAALLHCETHVDDRQPRQLDPLNALCDVAANLPLALAAESSDLICLHAAGVEIGGQLVVFPNTRRAGKSTLSLALARAGFRVFGDDVLQLSFPQGGAPALCQSLGIAPRLRLPLPETFPAAFRNWAEAAEGPQNRQYKYVTLRDQPARGETLPLGAFVLLDRQDDCSVADIVPVRPDLVMDALLHQNVTRDRHSADVLVAIAATLERCPVHRLTYADLDQAVACLTQAFGASPPAQPQVPSRPPTCFRLLEPVDAAPLPAPGATLTQRLGSVARQIGDALYLADAEGRAIHRLDPLAAAIWDLLQEPATEAELSSILADVFPDAAPDRIAADVGRLVSSLVGSGLVAPLLSD